MERARVITLYILLLVIGGMSRKNYKSLTIPTGLYIELERFVKDSNGYYVSVSEVVREALRDYLSKLRE